VADSGGGPARIHHASLRRGRGPFLERGGEKGGSGGIRKELGSDREALLMVGLNSKNF